MSDSAVIEPRDETDRKMVGRLHTRLFELSVQSLARLEEIITDPEADRRHVLMAIKLCMERTVPVVHRITALAAMLHLPAPTGEKSSQPVEAEISITPEIEAAAMRQLLRGRFNTNGETPH